MQIKNNFVHAVVLAIGMLAGGMIAVCIGKELNWDLANYHFYNPLAFLTNRSSLDVWPPEYLHVHLTPTADFLTYYFITYIQPKTAVFLLGALHGINFWLLYLIATELLVVCKAVTYTRALGFALAMLGMCGPTVLPALGSFQHDLLVSLFVLGFVYLFIKFQQSNNFSLLFASAVLLGIAAGLKLTAMIYVIAAIFSVLMMARPLLQRVKMASLIGGGVALGILATSGYWMFMQWQQYHNPVFPFLNAVFQSPDFPAYNWKDARFMPASLWQAIFFPFYFSLDGRTNDLPFRDVRFAVAYVLVAAVAIQILYRRKFEASPSVRWLLIFCVISYVIWQHQFSIMRYAMPLEMLTPLVIYFLLTILFQDESLRDGAALTAYVLIMIIMSPSQAVRAPWYAGDYFNVQLPLAAKHQEQALVLMPISAYAFNLKPRPQTYLIGSLPERWRYVGVAFNGDKYTLGKPAGDAVKRFDGRIFLLAASEYVPVMYQLAASIGLAADGPCADITSDRQKISGEDVKLCPLKK